MKALIFFSFLLAVTALPAQNMQINGAETTVLGSLADLDINGTMETSWDVQNISTTQLSVRARRNILSQVSGSANYFCWGVCFLENTNVSPVSVAQIINAGETNHSFYAHYRPNGNAGQTVVEYCFFETNNESSQVCHTVNYCVDSECTVSLNELEPMAGLSEIGPNPVSGLGSISYHLKSSQNNVKLTFYNMVGEIVEQIPLNGQDGIVIIHAVDFDNGIYLYSLSDNSGGYVSKKMIIAR